MYRYSALFILLLSPFYRKSRWYFNSFSQKLFEIPVRSTKSQEPRAREAPRTKSQISRAEPGHFGSWSGILILPVCRRPNSETRRPRTEGIPKSEILRRASASQKLLSDFGLRASDFIREITKMRTGGILVLYLDHKAASLRRDLSLC